MDNMRIILEQADHEGLKELLFAMVKCGLNIVVSDDSMEVIPHLRESTKYNFAGATIEKLYVESTVNEYNYGHEKKDADSDRRDPYEALLMQIIEPMREGRDWKAILMPYCAGVQEGVLPRWSHSQFIMKTGIAVPAPSYSIWMKKDAFTMEEMEPYTEQYIQLKRQIGNSD